MSVVIKYPGAKNRIADWICSFIPEHKVYLEPFFGGGAIFFNKKQKAHIETINDLNDDVFNFFKTLRDDSESLIRAIELTAYSRS
ncbi:MAG: DNA adenine methylase, partial [Solobacterium sp.]|nr:DNA adenine methylase [Solobacterium sp.]